ncbi:uncharacterized protein [Physcomitrium patens]|uniref:RNase III domain-containing protein n=1 Tax=Physcomitrium patens TaxID=3218 RepID=A0A7I4APW1_PHYPA|nr:uncharacterized protein LOC112291279 isoform X2 [Physcomitrium patens]|eukprot:XP_024394223.1 uncharacterized protein LOC112291279 isoform X2 [Physcomitrella patens]
MALHHRWACSWPWLATPGGGGGDDAASPVRPRRQRPPRIDLRKLLDRVAVVHPDSSSAAQDNAKVWLPSPPPVEKPRAVHNAASLAYLGDSIYEVYVRRHFLTPPQKVDVYNKRVMDLVCCEAQLLKGDFLTDEERDVVRWGKNIETGQRRASRRAGSKAYSSASALETLIGYLYLTDHPRLEELMTKVGFNVDSNFSHIGFGFQTADKSSSS